MNTKKIIAAVLSLITASFLISAASATGSKIYYQAEHSVNIENSAASTEYANMESKAPQGNNSLENQFFMADSGIGPAARMNFENLKAVKKQYIIIPLLFAAVFAFILIFYNVKSSVLKKKLSQTLLYGDPPPGSSFSYKNRSYDREKFIQLCVDELGQISSRETIEKALKKARIKSMKDSEGAVVSRLEVEAYERILKNLT